MAADATGEDVVAALLAVRERVATHATARAAADDGSAAPTLIAVSKTKPAELVAAAYGAGQAVTIALWLREPGKYSYLDATIASAPTCLELVLGLSVCVVAGDFLIYWE